MLSGVMLIKQFMEKGKYFWLSESILSLRQGPKSLLIGRTVHNVFAHARDIKHKLIPNKHRLLSASDCVLLYNCLLCYFYEMFHCKYIFSFFVIKQIV